MSLAVAVIGVLAEKQDSGLGEGCEAERGEDFIGRGIHGVLATLALHKCALSSAGRRR